MRKKFAELLFEGMRKQENIVLISADMGYGLWDKIRDQYPDRFFNVGSAEQLMLGMAVGMSMEKKIPVCYSITPFLLYRPFEFIRNYLNQEQHNVKLIGGGRDFDYGYLGNTHWAPDDLEILKSFTNIIQFKPETEKELEDAFKQMFMWLHPVYINLKK